MAKGSSTSVEITNAYSNNSNNHIIPRPFTIEILDNILLLKHVISDLTEYRDTAIEHLKQLQQGEGRGLRKIQLMFECCQQDSGANGNNGNRFP